MLANKFPLSANYYLETARDGTPSVLISQMSQNPQKRRL